VSSLADGPDAEEIGAAASALALRTRPFAARARATA
jgi:hypothetical protein